MTSNAANWVAVLGGASRFSKEQLQAAYRCGLELARHGKHVLTGATTGIPHAAALGAKDGGGLVVGISPATNAGEHVDRYRKPLSAIDLVIYSGMSLDGRAPLILRSAGAAIFIGGEMGTLAEFAAGWLCGCPYLGLLEGAGGITQELRRIASSIKTTWGSTVLCASNPADLVEEICGRMDSSTVRTRTHREPDPVAEITAALEELRRC